MRSKVRAAALDSRLLAVVTSPLERETGQSRRVGTDPSPDTPRRGLVICKRSPIRRGRFMAIPTELVGSLPRPTKLQQAYADYDEGKITWQQLQAEQDL